MNFDTEITKLQHLVEKLVKRVEELEEQINEIDASSISIRELDEHLAETEKECEELIDGNDKVTYELLNAVEDMQNVLSKKLDVEFQNKLTGLHINWWTQHMRKKIREQGR
jgi:seryl-tRNA synthetase